MLKISPSIQRYKTCARKCVIEAFVNARHFAAYKRTISYQSSFEVCEIIKPRKQLIYRIKSYGHFTSEFN